MDVVAMVVLWVVGFALFMWALVWLFPGPRGRINLRWLWHAFFGHPSLYEGEWTAGCRGCGRRWMTDDPHRPRPSEQPWPSDHRWP